MTHVLFISVSPNVNEFDTPAFCSIAPWVLEATWHAIERRCRLNALHDFHQWGLSAPIGSFLWCGGTSFAIHHQIHGICIVETSWLRFPSKFHACLVLVELVDVSLARCFFFGSWAYPKCTLRIPKPNWKNAWFWRAVVWYPAVQLEKTFVLCDYLGCAVEKKGVPCGCHFAPVILRQSFSLLAGKRPLTDWGMKTYFSRPESLPELRRLREHIKWHIWCGRIANPMESRWKCLTTDSKSPRWDFENP